MTISSIEKKDWIASFNLIGNAKVGDYTFKMDEKSDSGWHYNSMNLGIDCGEKHGVIYTEMSGGHSLVQDSVIYCHGKNEDGSDDFNTTVEVAWDDRDNEEIIESIGDMCFITVGLEKTDKGKTFYKKFLSAFDAIEYINQNLKDGMVVNVKGNLKYSKYKDDVQVKKEVKSIVLSKTEPDKYKASFTQTLLINKDSASLKNIDKDKSAMYVDAVILDYYKIVSENDKNNILFKGQYPFYKTFEFPLNLNNEKQCIAIYDKLFKVKKGYTQITFKGSFIESGATVQTTIEDIPDNIKEMIDAEIYTEEEVLTICASNGNKERRMILNKPLIRLMGEDKIPVIQKFEERYEDDELEVYVDNNDNNGDNNADTADTVGDNADSDGDMDWLNALDNLD